MDRCSVNGCCDGVLAKSMCNKHYIRNRRHGDVNAYKISKVPIKDRLEKHIERVTESGCWIWIGDYVKGGYGRVSVDRKSTLAHRASYAAYAGAIPDGMQVLHKCDIPECVNPSHLFIGTNQDNVDDKMRKGRWRGSHK